jgi:tyrosinase
LIAVSTSESYGSSPVLTRFLDLTPFWNGATTFHRSSTAGVRDWTKLNYTYPEYQGLHGLPVNKIHDAISNIVNQLYSGNASPAKPLASFAANAPEISAAVAPTATSPDADSRVANVAAFSGPAESSHASHGSDAHPRLLEWFVRVRSKKYALGASYSVLLFLGPPPEDQAEWRGSPNFVGLHFYFVNSSQERCANCASQGDLIDEGFVTITHALEIRGYESRSEAEIEQYLKANLEWRVQKVRNE